MFKVTDNWIWLPLFGYNHKCCACIVYSENACFCHHLDLPTESYIYRVVVVYHCLMYALRLLGYYIGAMYTHFRPYLYPMWDLGFTQ